MPQAWQPSVSVVIPTFNCAATLPDAIASVRSQRSSDLEIIVVDDGSIDDTGRVLDELAGPDLRVISQGNAGPAVARNRGIDAAHGEWVAFLDADDYWLPGKLKAQFDRLETTGGDFAFCGSILVDQSGNLLETRSACPMHSLASELVWGNQIATPTVIVRKALLTELGRFDETLTIGEDWDLWLRLAQRSSGCCVSDAFVAVRRSEWSGKYRVEMYEAAVTRTLSRFFTRSRQSADSFPFNHQQSRVWSWHFAVLAKSYLRFRNLAGFLRCGVRCLIAHPRGVSFLLGRKRPHV